MSCIRAITAVATVLAVTICAGGAAASAGQPGPGASVILRQPQAVAYDAGRLVVADSGNSRVLTVGRDEATTVAGSSGLAGFAGDGSGARTADLALPLSVAAVAGGGLLIADSANHRIRRVLDTGEIETVAGSGVSGFGGDDGAATAAQLSFPGGVAAGRDGAFVIADTGNNRIREVSPSGIVTTIAGGSKRIRGARRDPSCASLNSPSGVAIGGSGNLYFSDTGNNRVCRIAPDGSVSVVAGTGEQGYSGDDANARAATLARPTGLAVEPRGQLLIADTANNAIRRIGLDGKIRTVAGDGAAGFAGDSGPATDASLNSPAGVAAGDDGSFVIADTANAALRRVSATGAIATIAGADPGRAPEAAPLVLGVRMQSGFHSYICPRPLYVRLPKPLRVSFYTTDRAVVDIRILKGRRLVRHARFKAKPTSRPVLFKKLPPGIYRITLSANRSGNVRSSHSSLIVRARR